ncbi:hypothetical protein [Gelidibacter gilvus]|uniref:DUF3278 domain-containing protein n=1 Tax=Gelidibacter gilvus TaxID=59602 RepID=A0A4Q0XJW3_9FLAO|nr:hypothetical protein [Gelidibacter gilvus]RXJ52479.1 hypothetical protein ESZ48_01920 [Gelidibacter gilvus]
MKTFEDLKSQWEEQSQPEIPNDGSKIVMQRINDIQNKQRITNAVLLTTTMVLIGFFFYVNAYSSLVVSLGLLLMIGSLIVRIMIEFFSIKALERIDFTKDAVTFKTDMISYYKKRITTHYVATPIILALYATGFILLLPSFKQNLSQGFYRYIVVSAIVILIVMVFFIWKQIQKELNSLKQLKS